MKTIATCSIIPQLPATVLAIDMESETPFVYASYRPDEVPEHMRRKISILLIRVEHARKLFHFVLGTPGEPVTVPSEDMTRQNSMMSALIEIDCCLNDMKPDLTHKDISRCARHIATRTLDRLEGN